VSSRININFFLSVPKFELADDRDTYLLTRDIITSTIIIHIGQT